MDAYYCAQCVLHLIKQQVNNRKLGAFKFKFQVNEQSSAACALCPVPLARVSRSRAWHAACRMPARTLYRSTTYHVSRITYRVNVYGLRHMAYGGWHLGGGLKTRQLQLTAHALQTNPPSAIAIRSSPSAQSSNRHHPPSFIAQQSASNMQHLTTSTISSTKHPSVSVYRNRLRG
jgi:hypothetical protein